ncbi:hypothetical protein RMATCC62417_10811 [Rhizopus microsporus]|nr:hypothetical protein RMATCC62417_10811 [Rhizopus microsporus]
MGNDACARKKVDDKVNFRVVMKRYDVDLLNGEIASNTRAAKCFHGNRKIVRETKNIANQFYLSRFFSNARKMKIKVQFIQIAGTEGGVAEVSLVDNGLYINNRLGFLRLLSGTFDLDVARALICRLLDVKVYSPT